ncbi:MAG: hypothetical protein RJA07_1616 [Bacteroidota bacterium]|jgi:hypothetical protein
MGFWNTIIYRQGLGIVTSGFLLGQILYYRKETMLQLCRSSYSHCLVQKNKQNKKDDEFSLPFCFQN